MFVRMCACMWCVCVCAHARVHVRQQMPKLVWKTPGVVAKAKLIFLFYEEREEKGDWNEEDSAICFWLFLISSYTSQAWMFTFWDLVKKVGISISVKLANSKAKAICALACQVLDSVFVLYLQPFNDEGVQLAKEIGELANLATYLLISLPIIAGLELPREIGDLTLLCTSATAAGLAVLAVVIRPLSALFKTAFDAGKALPAAGCWGRSDDLRLVVSKNVWDELKDAAEGRLHDLCGSAQRYSRDAVGRIILEDGLVRMATQVPAARVFRRDALGRILVVDGLIRMQKEEQDSYLATMVVDAPSASLVNSAPPSASRDQHSLQTVRHSLSAVKRMSLRPFPTAKVSCFPAVPTHYGDKALDTHIEAVTEQSGGDVEDPSHDQDDNSSKATSAAPATIDTPSWAPEPLELLEDSPPSTPSSLSSLSDGESRGKGSNSHAPPPTLQPLLREQPPDSRFAASFVDVSTNRAHLAAAAAVGRSKLRAACRGVSAAKSLREMRPLPIPPIPASTAAWATPESATAEGSSAPQQRPTTAPGSRQHAFEQHAPNLKHQPAVSEFAQRQELLNQAQDDVEREQRLHLAELHRAERQLEERLLHRAAHRRPDSAHAHGSWSSHLPGVVLESWHGNGSNGNPDSGHAPCARQRAQLYDAEPPTRIHALEQRGKSSSFQLRQAIIEESETRLHREEEQHVEEEQRAEAQLERRLQERHLRQTQRKAKIAEMHVKVTGGEMEEHHVTAIEGMLTQMLVEHAEHEHHDEEELQELHALREALGSLRDGLSADGVARVS